MNLHLPTVIKTFLITIQLGITFFLFPSLPDRIPTHWNFKGEIDSYSSKTFGTLLVPIISIIMLASFYFLPHLDPHKKKYHLFRHEWQIIQIGLVFFFTYMQFIILYAAKNPTIDVGTLITTGIGALFILMGNYLSKIRQNFFIGIKTPWTLANEDNWNKTHRFASWVFVIAGILVMFETILIAKLPLLFFTTIFSAALLPVAYSLFIYLHREQLFKKGLFVIAAIFLLLFLLRLFSGPEDSWICDQGRWVTHGNPSSLPPQTPCK